VKRRGERVLDIMRALDRKSPQSTPELVTLLGEQAERQKVLTWYGAILRHKAEDGLVERGEWTKGEWQRAPALMWSITDAGREWITRVPLMTAREEAAAKARRRAEERARRTVFLREAERVTCASRAERKALAVSLKAQGCTLREIGDALGISAEMVRVDLGRNKTA
jgi:hypothetical protein